MFTFRLACFTSFGGRFGVPDFLHIYLSVFLSGEFYRLRLREQASRPHPLSPCFSKGGSASVSPAGGVTVAQAVLMFWFFLFFFTQLCQPE